MTSRLDNPPDARAAPASLVALREHGFSLHERGELQAAEQVYRALLLRVPEDLEVRHALGVLSVQTGRYGPAVELLRTVTAARGSAVTYGDLGNALLALGRAAESLQCYEHALALGPEYLPAHINRANALRASGRSTEARASYERALTLQPDNFEALVGLGELLYQAGDGPGALACYDRLIARYPQSPRPFSARSAALLAIGRNDQALLDSEQAIGLGADSASTRTLRGLALAGLKRPQEALANFEQAIAMQPDYVPAHISRGIVLRDLKRPEEALASYSAALAVLPHSFEALNNRIAVLLDLGRYQAALEDSERALALNRDAAEIHLNRAAALCGLDRHAEALPCYQRALELRPQDARIYASRAGALLHLRRSHEALLDCEQALALAPVLVNAHFNRGSALRDLMRIDEARQSFECAVSLRPDHASTQFSLGCLHLLVGRFEPGWALYEWRSRLKDTPAVRRFAQPRWTGAQEIAGKRFFVYADQGLGDTLQFCRYLPLLEGRGATVLLSVQNNLQHLMATLVPAIQLYGEADSPAAFDLHCPLASLPLAVGTTLASIPARVPYLAAAPERVQYWRQRLGVQGFKIGVCWQGSVLRAGIGRSFPLACLGDIASLDGVRLISLQKAPPPDPSCPDGQPLPLETLGTGFDEGPDAFADSAAVIANLDLVITCDTSMAHLVGALGRPAWVALKFVPDWRWMLDRADSPWYPSLRLYRQTVDGEWNDVFARMRDDLRACLSSTPPIASP